MSLISTNLAQVSQNIRNYISDGRPLNLDEMRTVVDIVDSVMMPMRRVVQGVNERTIPSFLLNDWRNIKIQLGV